MFIHLIMSNSIYAIQDLKMERLSRITELINTKSTGNPSEFALKIGIGKTRLRELIKVIMQAGLQVSYDRYRETYYFECEQKYELQCRLISKL